MKLRRALQDSTGVEQDWAGKTWEQYVIRTIAPDELGEEVAAIVRAGTVVVDLLDGERYRLEIDIDFTEGTNEYAPTGKGFCPPGHIGLDDSMKVAERAPVALHECNERGLMAEDWEYEAAHEDSNRKELTYRRRQAEQAAGTGTSAGAAAAASHLVRSQGSSPLACRFAVGGGDVPAGQSSRATLERYRRRLELLSL